MNVSTEAPSCQRERPYKTPLAYITEDKSLNGQVEPRCCAELALYPRRHDGAGMVSERHIMSIGRKVFTICSASHPLSLLVSIKHVKEAKLCPYAQHPVLWPAPAPSHLPEMHSVPDEQH